MQRFLRGRGADELYRVAERQTFLSFLSAKCGFFRWRGNVATVYTCSARARGFLRLLNFCFRHQSFMRHRMIRGERKKKLAGNYPVENQHRRNQEEGGRRDEPARGSGGRLEKERRGRRCRPKSQRRENLARRSVGGRKEVPVRGPPLAFLCIFDTSLRYLVSTLPFPPAHFLYLQASRDPLNAGIECRVRLYRPSL